MGFRGGSVLDTDDTMFNYRLFLSFFLTLSFPYQVRIIFLASLVLRIVRRPFCQ